MGYQIVKVDKLKDKEQIYYIKTFVDLLRKRIPTIYLGDIEDDKREEYFNTYYLGSNKYFKLCLGEDIVDSLIYKYDNKELIRGNWTCGNGVYFYYNGNQIIVLDYKDLPRFENSILVNKN